MKNSNNMNPGQYCAASNGFHAVAKGITLSLLASAAFASPAFAQDAAESASEGVTMGEIVVTARRRDESSKDVPISIIAASQETLNERSIRSATDLPLVSPGLSVSFQSGRSGIPLFSIRGQYQAFGGTGPGVVVYQADVPDFATQIYDMSSVQVLKGPQGTLFGRNSTGGAVLFNPAMPTSDFDAAITLRTGSRNRTDAEWAIGGGTQDGLVAVRFAGQYLKADGYTHNLGDGTDMDDEDKLSLRGSIVLRPTEWLENYTLVQYSRSDEQGAGLQIAGINSADHFYSAINPVCNANGECAQLGLSAGPVPGAVNLLSQVQAELAAQQARGVRTINLDGPHEYAQRSLGVINTTNITIDDNFSFKNIYSWRRHKSVKAALDYDGSSLTLAHDGGPLDDKTITQTEEMQLQGSWDVLDATLGFYHENVNTPKHTFFQFTQFQALPAAIAGIPPGPLTAWSIDNFAKRRSNAFYGQATVRPVDGWSITAGIRRTNDYRAGGAQTVLVFGPVQVPTGAPSSGVYRGSATTWNIDTLYEITPDLNFYAGVRRGYRSGGINNTTTGGGASYLPETVTDYEAGFKYSGLVGGMRVRANVDVFYDKYKNIQRSVTRPGTVNSTTVNAASGKTWGTDVDVTLAPNDMMSLQVTYSLLKTKYSSYDDPFLGDLSDGMFPGAPKHQLVIVPRVVPMSNDNGEVVLQSFAYYQSKTTHDVVNTPNGTPAVDEGSNGSILPGYWKVDLRADWNEVLGSKFGVSAFVKNVFDKEYVVSTSNLQASGPSYVIAYAYGAPRTWGLEMRYSF